jgi:hypothetical protein
MELSLKRTKSRQTYNNYSLLKSPEIPIQKSSHNYQQNNSLLIDSTNINILINDEIRTKAKLLLSVPITPRISK